jgi:hypothetical protein
MRAFIHSRLAEAGDGANKDRVKAEIIKALLASFPGYPGKNMPEYDVITSEGIDMATKLVKAINTSPSTGNDL